MGAEIPDQPSEPDLPNYVIEPLQSQSPDDLVAVAKFARELAAWKREKHNIEAKQRQEDDEIDEELKEDLEASDLSTDPEDYERVPSSGAYITTKTTKSTAEKDYRYFYWQWREGDTWKNAYIGPVDSSE